MTSPLPGPHEGLNAAVAAVLRAERAAQEVTIDALASAAQIPEVSVRRYLKAQRHIDVSVLYALAVALGTTPTRIIEAAQERIVRDQSGEDSNVLAFPTPSVPPSTVTEQELEDEPSVAEPDRVDHEGEEDPGDE